MQLTTTSLKYKYMTACLFSLFLSVSPANALTLTNGTVSGISGTQVLLPVKATNFTNLMNIQGTIQFNPAIVSFATIEGVSLPNTTPIDPIFDVSQAASGFITFSWDDTTLAGITLPNGSTIFSIRFNLTGSAGQQTSVNFVDSPTPTLFADINDIESAPTLEHGSVKICQTQSISLTAGWNMISGYMIPDTTEVSKVFKSIKSSTILVKNNAGQSYFVSSGFGSNFSWDYKQGYKVKTNANATLVLTCAQTPATTPISLNAGWNMISYLRTSTMNVKTALSSLGSNIILVKNNAGNSYIYSLPTTGNWDMVPGQGYQIKLSSAGTLTYPP